MSEKRGVNSSDNIREVEGGCDISCTNCPSFLHSSPRTSAQCGLDTHLLQLSPIHRQWTGTPVPRIQQTPLALQRDENSQDHFFLEISV